MPFGVYVHVPFCATRCGYCDFNTYTSAELGGGGAQRDFADVALLEIEQAARAVTGRLVDTVFFGGGTPTLLPAADLVRILDGVRAALGLAEDAEVTVEANPESVDRAGLAALREGGFTRVSFGMQSAVPHVLAVLDRIHRPESLSDVVAAARAAGFAQVSVDLIYGAAGESLHDWDRSLEAAVALEPDHVSAYALVVEPGTRLGRKVASGQVLGTDDDDLADKYLLANQRLEAAGQRWYEVSNWATEPWQQCRHNLGYWHSEDWWGVGPGAHSHLAGERWWNVKHPTAYAQRVMAGASPRAEGERLSAADQHLEAVMLQVRLAEGLPLSVLLPAGVHEASALAAEGLLRLDLPSPGRAQLTERGRLLADLVVRRILAAEDSGASSAAAR